jgi:hypothetical protein
MWVTPCHKREPKKVSALISLPPRNWQCPKCRKLYRKRVRSVSRSRRSGRRPTMSTGACLGWTSLLTFTQTRKTASDGAYALRCRTFCFPSSVFRLRLGH